MSEADMKPWLAAAPDEVWAVTYDGEESVYVVVEREDDYQGGVGFWPVLGGRIDIAVIAPGITAARRVWPEPDDG